MSSFNRGISTWRSLGTITLAFFAGSIALSLLPTPETSFTVLADLVQDPANDNGVRERNLQVREVALLAPKAEEKGSGDWPMWGGTPSRNNVPDATNIPSDWDIGEFDDDDRWVKRSGKNIKWVSPLGSQTYGNPVVADGRVYVGTNNGSGYIGRYPTEIDLGCLICFSEKDGSFLWQHSSEKLKTGRVHDWPDQGICCAPYVDGKRVWFVSSRGEVVCCDAEGFHDDENDGPFKEETTGDEIDMKKEADVIWKVNMMGAPLNISQHNMCSCSVTAAGDILFVNTSNGLDESHISLPRPNAPSFIAMDKNTGEILWTDKSPGTNILHGQWSSPAVGMLGDEAQVIFAGGDGWVYSFKANPGKDGQPELLWKFDANPKTSEWILAGRGTRNNIIATPVIYEDLVYVAVGQDPEHGEGEGHVWCIDPTKRGDVSPQLAMKVEGDKRVPIPHRRKQAVIEEDGEVAVDNENSAVVWHYSKFDQDADGEFVFEEEMHRSCGTVAIKDDMLYISDFSGLFHCLDSATGKVHWTHDMFAAAWGSPLITDGKVYIGDEDGEVSIFKLGEKESNEPMGVMDMGNSVYSTPIVANGVLYIANRTHLFAIAAPETE